MPHKCHTNATQMPHKCHTNATQMPQKCPNYIPKCPKRVPKCPKHGPNMYQNVVHKDGLVGGLLQIGQDICILSSIVFTLYTNLHTLRIYIYIHPHTAFILCILNPIPLCYYPALQYVYYPPCLFPCPLFPYCHTIAYYI